MGRVAQRNQKRYGERSVRCLVEDRDNKNNPNYERKIPWVPIGLLGMRRLHLTLRGVGEAVASRARSAHFRAGEGIFWTD